MEIKISVILPVYNVEMYLHECLNSIINQTLKDIEIICIDDGSTDNSLRILIDFQKKDSRIKILKQNNLYAGVARNAGLKIALGEYLVFLDSDDFFESTFLEKVYNQAKEKDADIVLFSAQKYNQKTKEFLNAPNYFRSDYIPKKDVFNRKDCPDRLFSITTTAPWTKLFRRKFIIDESIKFQALKNSNDVYFVLIALGVANRITYLNERFVNYRIGLETNLQSTKSKDPTCFIDAYVTVFEELKKRNLYRELEQSFINSFVFAIGYNIKTISSYTALRKIYCGLGNEMVSEINISNRSQDYYLRKKDGQLAAQVISISNFIRENETFQCINSTFSILKDSKFKEAPLISIIVNIKKDFNIETCLNKFYEKKDLELICLVDENNYQCIKQYKYPNIKIITSKEFKFNEISKFCLKGEYCWYYDLQNDITDIDHIFDFIRNQHSQLLYIESKNNGEYTLSKRQFLSKKLNRNFNNHSFIFRIKDLDEIVMKYPFCENFNYILWMIFNCDSIGIISSNLKTINSTFTFIEVYKIFKKSYNLLKHFYIFEDYSDDEKQIIYQKVSNMLKECRNLYTKLNSSEKVLYKGLNIDEMSVFDMLVVQFCDESKKTNFKKSIQYRIKRKLKNYIIAIINFVKRK